jgi:hypothetical protein
MLQQVSVTLHSPDGMEEKPVFAEDVIAALSGGSGAGDGSRHDSTMLVPLVELPPPPDGGWGWVVCFASFMCNLILDGEIRRFSSFTLFHSHPATTQASLTPSESCWSRWRSLLPTPARAHSVW